jgi:hypothetical protein
MSNLGPDVDVAWVDEPARAKAKQIEMLQIDIAHSAQWVETMRKLVAQELEEQPFTTHRMLALHEWERSRKRAQKNLHYKYDPVKRKRNLVERDIRRTIANARRVLAEHQAKLDAATTDDDIPLAQDRLELATRLVESATDLATADVVEDAERARRGGRPAKPVVDHPGLAGLSDSVLETLHNDLDGMDLTTSTDDEILDQYSRNGIPDEPARYYLGLINGTNQVEA